MTYGQFLAAFLLPALTFVAVWAWGKTPLPPLLPRPFWLTAGFLTGVAVLYTTPWDNYLVAAGIWTYPPDRVWGIRLGWVPLEEYLFFILQTLLTTGWLWGWSARSSNRYSVRASGWLRWGMTGILGIGAGVAWYGFYHGGDHLTYLTLILGWALPVIAGQWALGARAFLQHRRLLLTGILPPTLYLWAADTIAIKLGIWHIAEATSLQLYLPGGLPVEEAIFFLVTNLLVGLGFVLVHTWHTIR